jgi:hypothetical protein
MRAWGAAVVGSGLLVGAVALVPANASASRGCGSKDLYGHVLEIRVSGRQLPCSKVQKIVSGRCRYGRKWSCLSLRSPDPLLVWFREREAFKRRWTTTIELRRYPCSQASVSASAWAQARDAWLADEFPTRPQVLADDLIRCHLLRGMMVRQVRDLLGRPDGSSLERGHRFLDYDIGPERDSFIQIDDEFLSIEFRRDGVFRHASIYQG